MKKIVLATTLCLSLFAATSCNKENVPAPVSPQNQPSHAAAMRQTQERKTVTFYYGTNTYSVTAIIKREDGVFVSADPVQDRDFFAVQALMQANPNMGLFFQTDSKIHLYGNANEMAAVARKVYPNMTENPKDLNINYYTCQPYYQMFEHVDFNGAMLYNAQNGNGMLGVNPTSTCQYDQDCYCVPWVGAQNNDVISSIKVSGGTLISIFAPHQNHVQFLTVFEHINYGGYNETFSSDGCNLEQINNLKERTMWVFIFIPISWNDAISSFKAYYDFH